MFYFYNIVMAVQFSFCRIYLYVFGFHLKGCEWVYLIFSNNFNELDIK